MKWLPTCLPPNVYVIVSMIPEKYPCHKNILHILNDETREILVCIYVSIYHKLWQYQGNQNQKELACIINQQESILVGCVPPAFMVQGGVWSRGEGYGPAGYKLSYKLNSVWSISMCTTLDRTASRENSSGDSGKLVCQLFQNANSWTETADIKFIQKMRTATVPETDVRARKNMEVIHSSGKLSWDD